MATKKASTKSNAIAAPRRTAEDRRWEAQDALRTIQRAQEIQKDKGLMSLVKREAQSQLNALSKVVK